MEANDFIYLHILFLCCTDMRSTTLSQYKKINWETNIMTFSPAVVCLVSQDCSSFTVSQYFRNPKIDCSWGAPFFASDFPPFSLMRRFDHGVPGIRFANVLMYITAKTPHVLLGSYVHWDFICSHDDWES